METKLQTDVSTRQDGVSLIPKPHLPRALGPIMATAIVVGTVIGSGVFMKPKAVALNVPNFGCVALVWILGGTLALFGSLALAEVAVLFPRAGGNYVFLREGYGRAFGFLWGWVEFWIIRTASIAALATIVTEQMHGILRAIHELPGDQNAISYWEERFLTVGIIVGLMLVNIRGVRWGGFLQVFITAVKIGSLLAIMLLPFVIRGPIEESTASSSAGAVPVEFSWQGIGVAMLGVQWAYHGWMNIAPIAEEVRQPQRNIPIALFAGIGIIIFVYLGANVAYNMVIPLGEMRALTNNNAAAEMCLRLLGPVGAAVAAGAVLCSAFGSLNGNIMVGPRLLYAMGQDKLAPLGLSALHPRYQTPALAIGVVALWSCLLVLGGAALARFGLPVWEIPGSQRILQGFTSALANIGLPEWELAGNVQINLNLPPKKELFDVLTDFAMLGAVIFETMAVSTIFVFRWRIPNVERRYRCFGYPVTPIIYVAILTTIAVNTLLTQGTEAAAVLGFVAVGAGIYVVALRNRA